jgi:hypothetical protein
MSVITRVRGDTYAHKINIIDADTRLALDVVGNTFTLSVSTLREPTAASYIFQVTGSITDAAAGKVSFPIGAVEANNFGNYFFDIEMVSGTEIRTIDIGSISFIQDITK